MGVGGKYLSKLPGKELGLFYPLSIIFTEEF
jgi:hypothetical protein